LAKGWEDLNGRFRPDRGEKRQSNERADVGGKKFRLPHKSPKLQNKEGRLNLLGGKPMGKERRTCGNCTVPKNEGTIFEVRFHLE